MKNSERIKSPNKLIWRITRINVPTYMARIDKIEIFFTVKLYISPIIHVLTINEASKILARLVYQETKNMGWRKVRDGSKVSWTRDKSFIPC